jgi:hypothetical protein
MPSLRDQIAACVRQHRYTVETAKDMVSENSISFFKYDADVNSSEAHAADAILKLIEPRGESELREALEPILGMFNSEMPDTALARILVKDYADGWHVSSGFFNVGDLRRARQALDTPPTSQERKS